MLIVTSGTPRTTDFSAVVAQIKWGESNSALAAQFAARAAIVSPPIDFGDSYASVVLRGVRMGGVPVIAFFEMDQRTGGLKRVQLERPRHGVNPPAFRAIVQGLESVYGRPDAVCDAGAGPANGYQAAAAGEWRRGTTIIRAIYRDTTIEAFEGCLSGDLTSGPCGLTGQILVRISPPGDSGAGCAGPPPLK